MKAFKIIVAIVFFLLVIVLAFAACQATYILASYF